MNSLKGNILVVDDHSTSRLKMSLAAKHLGHTVDTAVNGVDALEKMRTIGFDLVLLDLLMPEMDGYEVLSAMKEDPDLQAIPVIVISAVEEMESVIKAIELGAEDHLPKAFDPVLLRARVGACLEKKSLRDNAAQQLVSEARLKAGGFFVSFIFILILYQWLLGAFIEYSSELKSGRIMDFLNPAMMILMCAAAYFRAIKSGFPLRHFGLNLDNWASNIKQSLLWTSCFLIATVFCKWLATLYLPLFEGQSVMDYSITERYSTGALLLIYSVYALLSPVQEFIARGVIQTSLMQLLHGENKLVMSIFLSNLAFSSFHIHFDMKFALLTLIPGVFWGIMYHKQKSLLGVSISHAIIGIFIFVCMGGNPENS